MVEEKQEKIELFIPFFTSFNLVQKLHLKELKIDTGIFGCWHLK